MQADLISGLTVGVMAVPQSVSFAAMAGLPAAFGLYTAFVPVLAYCLMGSSRHLVSIAATPIILPTLLWASGGAAHRQACLILNAINISTPMTQGAPVRPTCNGPGSPQLSTDQPSNCVEVEPKPNMPSWCISDRLGVF